MIRNSYRVLAIGIILKCLHPFVLYHRGPVRGFRGIRDNSRNNFRAKG